MTTVLVTGAGGFLGSALVKELPKTGFHVRALVRAADSPPYREAVETVVGDIRDPACVKRATAGCDAVVHLAGKAHALEDEGVSEEEYQSVNVEGTKRLLEASVSSGVRRFVFASSVKVFGERTSGCIDEQTPAAPQTAYARSKWAAEQLVASHTQPGGLATVSFRLPLVYGPTRKGNLHRMIAAIDRGRFPPLPPLGTVRSMLHVGNFVAAVRAALMSISYPLPMYVVADAKPYSTTKVYELLLQGLGRQVPRVRVPLWILETGAWTGDALQALIRRPMPLSTALLEKLTAEAWYSPVALMRDLGYQPRFTFEAAVPDLIEHYRQSLVSCGS